MFTDPVYVGLAVCAHDNKVIEEAEFAEVHLTPVIPAVGKPRLNSTLEIVPVGSQDRQAIYHSTNQFEAPNWSLDGSHFVFNSQGSLFRLPVKGGTPERIDTGSAKRCNNDHGFSPDGKQIVISDQSQADGKSLIYILPATGGTPRLVTPTGPSYWHGWSPDGTTLAYCAERGGKFDVYAIPAEGGEERRLTTAEGLDDGPEYSPDGRKIYFNSDRTGRMQIWCMNPDGSGQEPVTNDELNNWFRASIAGRQMARVPVLREGRAGPPGQRGRAAATDAGGRRPHPGTRLAVRWPGHDQRAVVVARQPPRGVRQLLLHESVGKIFAQCFASRR